MTTVKYTLDQARTRELAHVGAKGLPQPWWTLPAGNDCIAYQLWVLGLRGGDDFAPHWISISKFREWAKWPEVSPNELAPGDLVLENWSGELVTEANVTPGHEDEIGKPIAEHMEYVYSVDHDAKKITTVSANTGPVPGTPVPRGVYKKTRDLDDHFRKGIRPVYPDEKVTTSRATEVRDVAAYLNTLSLGKQSYASVDGVEGPIYWWLVQTWGHRNGVYGKGYVIDGVPGPQTRRVEALIYKLARK